MADIYKAAGIIIKDKKLLATRTKGKPHFFAPGGKIEPGETPIDAVIRELKEELDIICEKEDLEPFGTFEAKAWKDRPGETIEMVVFTVKNYSGEIKASSEIEELRWFTSADENDPLIGSIFAHEVVPRLKKQGLID